MTKSKAIKVLLNAGLDDIQAEAQLAMFMNGVRGAMLHDSVFDIIGVTTHHIAEVNGEEVVVAKVHEIGGAKYFIMKTDTEISRRLVNVKCDVAEEDEDVG